MRIPVFARRRNPSIDKPILRKSLTYGEEQVRSGLAVWVDPADHSKGIVACEMLPSGKTLQFVETISVSEKSLLPPLEPNGCVFDPPPTAQPTNPVVRWMTAAFANQKSKRIRMEEIVLRRQAATS